MLMLSSSRAACSSGASRPAALLASTTRPAPAAAALQRHRPSSGAGGALPPPMPPHAGRLLAVAATPDDQQPTSELSAASPEEQARAADAGRGGDMPGGVGGFTVPHDGRASPMSEVKKSAAEQQGGAPEGDRAIQGQAWQPTEQDGETPADRFGSEEAAAQAAEDAKDRSRKSKIQTGDMDGDYAKGSA